MSESKLWGMVHAERAALAEDLAGLKAEQWNTGSLCTEFTVREVVAHLTAGANLGPVRWMAGVIRYRFDFDAQVAYQLAQQLGNDHDETLERFRRSITSTTKPPIPIVAMLGEVIVHGEDIRRPLRIQRDYPIATLTHVAEYYHRSNMTVPSEQRSRGLRLCATDGPFSGGVQDGALVSGSTLALIMAMAGRSAYRAELAGEGAGVIAGSG
ncbi:maleylpyruvate isomerase family mycothiol-dependent enzyme [Sinomonas sp. JGH33]|uniref:Maleylpyruvate isomerase family mycothiol-dependent enzyme n=1 Tax=Sinomonas terricola TaxID=3110330 RepID=A0ABU5T167_9MICC|nr:maleylpyruvate isomerase family mycothiol-dependent enzyme [Sinomonas sp. JGH33]MEA5453236.1 maleylpyruvate isomerase family mycothiol-dependent enzyme [Sinomonas sp. JGH33]